MPVYLDHAATTPMRPEAVAAFTGALGVVGNPSSIHSQGQQARRMLEEAREAVAATLGCDPVEVVFTSGGTEAINLAVKGMYWARNADAARPRILVPGGEHHATVDTVEWLERAEGARPQWLPLDAEGRILPPSFAGSEDVALLVADACGASLIAVVGTHWTLEEFLDKGRPGMASTFLTHLRVGSKLVNARGVHQLYQSRISGWSLVALVVAAAVTIVVAIAYSPAGPILGNYLSATWHTFAYWFTGLF